MDIKLYWWGDGMWCWPKCNSVFDIHYFTLSVGFWAPKTTFGWNFPLCMPLPTMYPGCFWRIPAYFRIKKYSLKIKLGTFLKVKSEIKKIHIKFLELLLSVFFFFMLFTNTFLKYRYTFFEILDIQVKLSLQNVNKVEIEKNLKMSTSFSAFYEFHWDSKFNS